MDENYFRVANWAFNIGQVLAATEDGHFMAYNDTDKEWQNKEVNLYGSGALDFGSTGAQNSADLTLTVTGAADGDSVSLGVPNSAVNANSCFTAWVSASNTVTVRFNNYSSGAIDPASGTFKATVIKE